MSLGGILKDGFLETFEREMYNTLQKHHVLKARLS